MAEPGISGLSNNKELCFLGKNKQLSFYKVFTEIGSLGFTEFGIDSKRTDVSK